MVDRPHGDGQLPVPAGAAVGDRCGRAGKSPSAHWGARRCDQLAVRHPRLGRPVVAQRHGDAGAVAGGRGLEEPHGVGRRSGGADRGGGDGRGGLPARGGARRGGGSPEDGGGGPGPGAGRSCAGAAGGRTGCRRGRPRGT
eukprot:16444093-Heterocapsa_arctica.AAC.1